MKNVWKTAAMIVLAWSFVGCGGDGATEGENGTPDGNPEDTSTLVEMDGTPEQEESDASSAEPEPEMPDVQEDAGSEEESDAELTDAEATKPLANLVINEVVVKAAENGPDWIEIHNLGGTKAELEGWEFEMN